MSMNKRAIGTNQEIKAAEYLKNQGYEILERNFRCRIGEIDIIARDGRYLVFVEVKYTVNPVWRICVCRWIIKQAKNIKGCRLLYVEKIRFRRMMPADLMLWPSMMRR